MSDDLADAALHRRAGVLTVIAPPEEAGRSISVDPRGSVVGRDVGCQLPIASERISRHHAVVRARGGEYEVEDLGSTNGTLLNGEPITGVRRLRDGDRICVADIEIEFQLLAQPPQVRRGPEEHRGPSASRRVVMLGVLWAASLLAVVALTQDSIDQAGVAVSRRAAEVNWVVPFALAVSITVLLSPFVERRWPDPVRRFLLALIVFVAIYGMTAAFGPLGALLVLGLAAVAASLAAWVLILPRRLAPSLPAEVLDSLEERDRMEVTDARLRLQNDLRTTSLQAVAGLAVLAGAILAFQQLTEDRQQATATRELALQGQASERFTRAIDQLGSARPEVQIGGIYGLEQVAQQAPDNRLPMTEVLVAYLHRRSPRPARATRKPTESLRERAPEVQAALTVLIRRRPLFNDPPLDLRGLDLSGADISGQFVLVSNNRPGLNEGDLRGAILRGTDLRGAVFSYVYLSGADLRDADLRGADLRQMESTFGNDPAIYSYPGFAGVPDGESLGM